MSDITISYKGSSIATMDASGTKTLLTEGKYCEDDIEVAYVKPSGGGAYSLLNSGEYTIESTGNINIPVTFTGTPKVIVVKVKTRTADTAQCLEAISFLDGADAFDRVTDFASDFSGLRVEAYIGENASNVQALSVSTNQYLTLNDTNIYSGKVANAYPWISGDYLWYIYGIPASSN